MVKENLITKIFFPSFTILLESIKYVFSEHFACVYTGNSLELFSHSWSCTGVLFRTSHYGTRNTTNGYFPAAMELNAQTKDCSASMKSRSRSVSIFFLLFPENRLLTFHANCLLRRQFAWNVKAYFLQKISSVSSAESVKRVVSILILEGKISTTQEILLQTSFGI